jgi:hypothetical protein
MADSGAELVRRITERIAAEPPEPESDGSMFAAFGSRLIRLPFLHDAGPKPPPRRPPCRPEEVDRSEVALGVRFPPLMRRLYTEVGDGGFGPGDGILGLDGLAREHQSYAVELAVEQEFGVWPAALLPFCQLDQTLIACIDCATPAGAIVGFEVDDLDWDELQGFEEAFSPRAASLEQWLTAWLDGDPV